MRFYAFVWFGRVLEECVRGVQGGVDASVCWAK